MPLLLTVVTLNRMFTFGRAGGHDPRRPNLHGGRRGGGLWLPLTHPTTAAKLNIMLRGA